MPASFVWQPGPNGGTPTNAANLNRLAVVADVGVPGTPTGDALKAAFVAAGGIDPTDVGYDVVAILGQSNAVGGGTDTIDTTYLDPSNPRIKQWPGSGPLQGQIVTGIDGLYHVYQAQTVGPGMPFAREYIKRVPNSRSLLLVPCAEGATGFTPTTTGFDGVNATWDPADTTTTKNLYNLAVASIDAALAAAGANARLTAVLWVQGENDASPGGMTQAAYAAKLDSLIDAIRSHYASPTLPFIVGQMVPSYIAANSAAYGPINAAHIDTPRRKTSTGFSYGATGAGTVHSSLIHYSAAGNRSNGAAMYGAYLLAQANVLGTAPVTPGAVTLVQSGTSLTVSWVRAGGRITDYAITYSVNGGAWTALTRAQSIDATATITGLTLGATVQVRIAAVNEQGTSAPATASLALATLPAQVAGLVAGTATSFTQPLSWNVAATATSYLVEKSTDGGSTWAIAGTATSTSFTATGLAPVTSYKFRVSAQNAAGTGTASAAVTATTSAIAAIIDQIGVAAWGSWSLRRSRAAYAGSAIKVRRSSDSTTTTIGFDGTGALDTATLLTFCGAGDGFIDTIYDQSGNGRDLTASSAAEQPKIVAAGALVSLNSVVAMLFSASALRRSTSGLYAAGSATTLAVIAPTAISGAMFSESHAIASAARYLPGYINSSQDIGWTIINDAAGNEAIPNSTTTIPIDGTAHVTSAVDTGTAVSVYFDGAIKQGPSNYTRSGAHAMDTVALGSYISSTRANSFTGKIGELHAFATALTDTQRQTGEANLKAVYSTP